MATPAKKEEGKVPVTTDLERMMQEDAVAGMPGDASDYILPSIKILQPLSPQVQEGVNQVPGAKAGDLMLGHDLIAGKEGIWFQPAAMEDVWFEFQPREQGGGFVASHPFTSEGEPPPGARRVEKFRFRFGNGNECVHRRHVFGVAWVNKTGLEYVIPFTSTGHTIARTWKTEWYRANRYPDGRSRPPFAHLYKLTTQQKKNPKGQWYVVNVGPAVLLGTPQAEEVVGDSARAYAQGKGLAVAFERRERQAEVMVEEEQAEEAL